MGQDLPSRHQLTNGTWISLNILSEQQHSSAHQLFNQVVLEGKTFPQNQALTREQFDRFWLSERAFGVCGEGTLWGSFYLRANHPGRCAHIANAGFIVASDRRKQGIGRVMGEQMLHLAKELGFCGVQFNLVFASNQASIQLWQSLGFVQTGYAPQAVQWGDGKYEDALLFYRAL